MLLRILDRGSKKKAKAETKADREAKAAYEKMQARLDAQPKFSATKYPAVKTKGKTRKETQPERIDMLPQGFPDLTTPVGRTNTHKIKSHNPADTTGAELRPAAVYTGTKVKGIATMHKSNGIPVFSDDHLVDIANMRRNDYTK